MRMSWQTTLLPPSQRNDLSNARTRTFAKTSSAAMVTFTARRSEPELVRPARPTPVETKALSDLDDQWSLRFYESIVGFFRAPPGEAPRLGKVARGIKAAVAAALVYYYPMAGRLRKLPGGNRLAVDCTGEGVAFVEASADVRLQDLGQPLVPPYPCVEEFLGDCGDTRDVLGKPLLFLQVISCFLISCSISLCGLWLVVGC